jgi:hypothetical protein
LDLSALSIPCDGLAGGLAARIAKKNEVLSQREKTWGKDRVMINSFMENLAWPEVYGPEYDINRFLADPETQYDLDLRTKLFWLDNSLDDSVPALALNCTVGMYFDMTLLGMDVTHTPQGVPIYGPHPLAKTPSLSVFRPFDFQTTGAMPVLLNMHRRLSEMAKSSRPELSIDFPWFIRGPLDIYIQMRTYEGFVEDTAERPEFVHQALGYFVQERTRWNGLRAPITGRKLGPNSFIADDWAYVPFITPAMFREFVIPAYQKIERTEGPLAGFHTCGNFVPLAGDVIRTFPNIKLFDVSGWNDIEALDACSPVDISFSVSFINTFVLTASEAEHRSLLERIGRVAKKRKVSATIQAIVRLHDTFAEDIGRMNRFIELARQVLAG